MLTAGQIAAIVMLLQAFGVSPTVIGVVRADITPSNVSSVSQNQPVFPVEQSTTPVQNTTVQPTFGATIATTSPTMDESTPACPAAPTLTANFLGQTPSTVVKDRNGKVIATVPGALYGPDITAAPVPVSQSISGSQYVEMTYFEVNLMSNCTPLNQLQFSIQTPNGYLDYVTGIPQNGDAVPYTGSSQFGFAATTPGTYPIIITATDPAMPDSPQSVTLTVTAH